MLIKQQISTETVSLKARTCGHYPTSLTFQFPLRRPVKYGLSAELWPCPREGGLLQMLAFTQVNSLTDIERAGRDKELDKSSGEVIQLALLLLLLSKQPQI